jgi:hypothetical protein
MKTQRRIIVTIICAFAVLASIVGVAAQETREKVARAGVQNFTFATNGPEGATFGSAQGDNTFVFVSSEMSIDGKVVKGAPYSAEAVTETVQSLPGGNRIVRRNAASVYRDSEGRTRREQTINHIGAYAASGEPHQTIFINDPVAKVNYILEGGTRSARKIDLSATGLPPLPPKKWILEGGKPGSGEGGPVVAEGHKIQAEAGEMRVEIARGGPEMSVLGPAGAAALERSFNPDIDSKNSKKESLGKQMIEGVEAEGTRSTTTIAAGLIGNEQPIEIISESWYSAELQTVVMSRHSDPRIGETTYRLTNINRSEPAHSLFEVPSDYTIQETIAPGMRYKIESELRRSKTEKKDQ